MSGNLVTVIIPVYNAGGYLLPAVQSVLNQTHREIEIIVVDDGSTDNCITHLDGIRDARLRIIRQDNKGKSAAVNLAIDTMTGEFWMVQDADDMSHPERVEIQLAALLADPSLAAVFCCVEILVNGRLFAPQIEGLDKAACRDAVESMRMPAHDATGLYRMSLVGDFRYDPDLRIGEGFDLIMRIGERFPIAVISDCLYSHRMVASSLTHTCARTNVEQMNKSILKTCLRRGLDPANYLQKHQTRSKWFKHRDIDTVVSYAMTSVAQHKRQRMMGIALRTAISCALLHPLDPLFYRPLARFLIPDGIIKSFNIRRNAVEKHGNSIRA